MNCIADTFNEDFTPVKFLAIYCHQQKDQYHVESYDPSPSGRPINAHPLGAAEASSLGRILSNTDNPSHFLLPKGIMPDQVLHLSAKDEGSAIWHTPAIQRQLYFSENLKIPSGKAWTPPLLWVASRKSLRIFALRTETKPDTMTVLYHAPFFNTNAKGDVCMGTVKIDIPETVSLETFMYKWEKYFFSSYFSHSNMGRSPLTGNIVSCWKKLIDTDARFPVEALRKQSVTLKKLL
ncbi:PRTRC system protein B [Chitinophaga sp. XS-30]|uniref:PRTRC system protein B n=1 Tax=Chitinophaga sp. XS-30 TaxID=2604421 RepID=UPI0011DE3CF4|nr:PRTRC system protein B [Chitinophaga sp. XS-30]QEH39419.1 PRTRC system protein B [Chitinophaga sp. XS-30]